MVRFEQQITQSDIARIKDRLSHYTMDVLHDDGLYRHLHCYWAEDPYGKNNCSFHVITAPGLVTIHGDWMSAATLKRETDMLNDFLNVSHVDLGYWAEKLDAPSHCQHDIIHAIDENRFMADVAEIIYEWTEGNEMLRKQVLDQIRSEIVFDDALEHPFTALLNMTFDVDTLAHEDTVQASDIFDFEMAPGEHFTHEWVRTCLALQWAANTYAKRINTQR